MRPQRIDITGNTDGNGNATIPVKLPQTGEWFDLKFPLSLPGPAEWAILASGTPLTYGRGRRVTLGPELIQNGETITVTVTSGPANAPIVGSANGRSGTPDEILAGFTPAPNTIALDTSSPIVALKQKASDSGIYSIPPNTVQTNLSFPLPAGIQSVRFEINQLDVTATRTGAKIIGNVTGKQYNANTSNPGGPGGADETWELDPEDTALLWSIDTTGSANAVAYWLNGHQGTNFVATRIVQNFTGQPVFVRDDAPQPWQAANLTAPFSVSITIGTPVVIVAGVGGKQISVHSIFINTNAQANVLVEDTTGFIFARGAGAANQIALDTDLKGYNLVTGRGIQLDVAVANAGLNGTIAYFR